jgi:hypothetical protein
LKVGKVYSCVCKTPKFKLLCKNNNVLMKK